MGRRTRELSEMSKFFAKKNAVDRTRRDNLLLRREDDRKRGGGGGGEEEGILVDCIIPALIAVVYRTFLVSFIAKFNNSKFVLLYYWYLFLDVLDVTLFFPA